MSWIESKKTQFQTALNTALSLDATASNNEFQIYQTTSQILFSAFTLFSNSTETPEIFEDPETASKLEEVIDVINAGLHLFLIYLVPDQDDSAKVVRSALQYFSDEYHGKFTEILSSDFVEELDEKIEICNNPTSLLQFPHSWPKADLIHVPKSHVWWLEEERNNTN